LAILRNNRPSLVWLPAVQTGVNPKTGKAIYEKGPKGRRTKLLPGLNLVDDDVVAFAKKHPVTKVWFKTGLPYGRGPILVVEEREPEDIHNMKLAEAKAVIDAETDEMKLAYWQEHDDRKGIKDAIEARLERLKAPPGSVTAQG